MYLIQNAKLQTNSSLPFSITSLFRKARPHPTPSVSDALPHHRRVANQILYDAVQVLCTADRASAHMLEARFMDNIPVNVLATQRNIAESHVYKVINKAIDQLTCTIITKEQECLGNKRQSWLERIDTPTYLELVGVEAYQQKLLEMIVREEPPWILSVEGIGGIGKTSLTHSVIMQLVERCPFDEICWVSTKSEFLSPVGNIAVRSDAPTQPQSLFFALLQQVAPEKANSSSLPFEQLAKTLRSHLKEQRYLIVIDNLETVTELEELLPHLESLVNPSRVILTSREQADIIQPAQRFIVPELNETDSLELIHQEAANTGLTEVGQQTTEELAPIYKAVGGNPLALRLVTGLLHTQSLADLLSSLENAPTRQTDNLYTFIYQQSWENLDDLERQVLLAMPLIQPAGDTQSYLADITSLPHAELGSAINQLAKLSLLQVHRDKPAYRYSIHSLTRTFLLNDAIGWK